jgi:hypothetical protein
MTATHQLIVLIFFSSRLQEVVLTMNSQLAAELNNLGGAYLEKGTAQEERGTLPRCSEVYSE